MSFFRDIDGDGHGNSDSGLIMACRRESAGPDYVDRNTDCDDSDRNVFPGAQEICDNRKDDNCNGTVDTDAPSVSTFYRDGDGDGYGSAASGMALACAPPAGHVSSNTDCNDTDATIHPTAREVCNAKDDDCNASTDEGLAPITCGAPTCTTTVPACVAGVAQTCTPVCPDAGVPPPPDAAPPDTARPPDTAPVSTTDARLPDRPPTATPDAASADTAAATDGGRVTGADGGASPADARTGASADAARTDVRRDGASDGRIIRAGGGGCNCRVESTGEGGLPMAAAALLLVILIRRRRRSVHVHD
jgi:MYXO-CTERM domain-containing protein